MKIIVCVKQVPENNNVQFDPKTNNLVRNGLTGRMNPFDANAIEAGLRLREQNGGEVTLLSMGPQATDVTLRDGLAMGADSAVLLSSRAFAGADTLATGYVLAKAIEKIGQVDLILFGRQAVDADTGQVGPIVAEFLNVPQATYASSIQIENNHQIKVMRDLDSFTQTVSVPLPAVVSVRDELNQPRYETPVGIQSSFQKPLIVMSDKDLDLEEDRLGQAGSPTQVRRIYAPKPSQRKSISLSKDPSEAAGEVLTILQSNGLL